MFLVNIVFTYHVNEKRTYIFVKSRQQGIKKYERVIYEYYKHGE